MTRLRYHAAVAAVLFGSLSVTLAGPGHRSFSSSLIASAVAKFRHVKDTPRTQPTAATVVATSATVVDNGKFVMDPPHPKFTGGDQGAANTDQSKGDTGKPQADTQVKKDISVDKNSDGTTKKSDSASKAPIQKAPVQSNGLITNLYDSQDIRAVISDVSSLAGVTIVPDDTVKEQNISVDFKGVTVESALDTLSLMAGAYWKKKSANLYLISKALPESNLFREFAETQVYIVHNQKAASIQALLSSTYKPYISVDPSTNAIGVSAPRQLLDKIIADIQQADKPGKQIIVEAMITEVNVDDTLNTGFSWATNKFSLGTDLSLNYQKAGFADIAKIQALIGDHKANLRANPRLMTIEGRESNINVGTDTYFSLLSGSTTFPTSQIQLIHTGIILKFTAFIGTDDKITMHLEPEVSDAVVLQNGNPSSQVRRSQQDVRVRSGETIVIAGLIQQNSDNQIIRVPILGYIPLLGEIFTQRTRNKKKIETIIMITPKVVEEAP